MNKLVRIWRGFLPILAATVILSSCGEDDPTIDVGDGLQLADGYYLALTGEDPVAEKQLVPEKIEGAGFAATDRDGFYGNYVFLEAGDYDLVKVESREITSTLGGTLADDEESVYKLAIASEGGASLAISPSGYYKVSYDETLKEIIVMQVTKVSLIGSSAPNGWGSDTELDVKGTASDEGFVFEKVGIVMRSGEYKIRINNRWTIDRRIDKTASEFDPANGYVAFTNYGGTNDLLVPGGSNITRTEEGTYTITVTLTNEGGAEYVENRTGDAPVITFDPSEYQWAITGAATPNGWANDDTSDDPIGVDMDLTYALSGSSHTWTGTFTLTADAFKFRTNDAWDVAPNANSGFFTIGGPSAGLIDVTGNDFVATEAGDYEFIIATSDDGDSWTLTITKQ